MQPEPLYEIPTQDLKTLERLFRIQFLDIHKVISLFGDSKRAQDFKKVNTAFMIE